MSNQNKEDLRAYRTLGLTLLQLMAVLATVGIVGKIVVGYLV